MLFRSIGIPYQYIYNGAFQLKMVCLVLLGLNLLLFYAKGYRVVETLGPGEEAPPVAKFAAGVSLALWTAVIWSSSPGKAFSADLPIPACKVGSPSSASPSCCC